jgi:tetratricopeptide (TPR) repeat protein
LGRHDEAVVEARAIIELRPNHSMGHTTLAYSLRSLGRLAEAEEAARKVVELHPRKMSPRQALVRVLVDRNRFDEAVREIEIARHLEYDSDDALRRLGVSAADSARPLLAIEILDHAVRRAPPHSVELALALAERADVLSRLGRVEAALRSCDAAVALAQVEAGLLYRVGGVYRRYGRVGAARAAFRRATAVDPRIPLGAIGEADLLLDAGDPDAIRVIEETLAEVTPSYRAFALAALGSAELRLGRFRAARARLEIAAEQAGVDFSAGRLAWGNLSAARLTLGDAEGGLGAARRDHSIDPWDSTGIDRVMEALLDCGRADEAIAFGRALEKRVAGRPLEADIRAHVANWILRCKCRAYEEGEAEARASLAVRRTPKALEVLARVKLETGDYDAAIEALEEAASFGASDYAAKYLPHARRAKRLESRFDELAAVPETIDSFEDAASLSRMAFSLRRYRAAYRFGKRADEIDPTDTEAWGYALDAILAGTGQGLDAPLADSDEAAALRRSALEWLRETMRAEPRTAMRWHVARYLRLVRVADVVKDPAKLALLPEDEREEWKALWSEVEAVYRDGVEPE